MLQRFIDILRSSRDVLYGATGFLYDYFRYLRYGGWRREATASAKIYSVIKIYHALEKSLSFRDRNRGSGWKAATQLFELLQQSAVSGKELHYQERVAVKVLADFLSLPGEDRSEVRYMKQRLGEIAEFQADQGGALRVTRTFLREGNLADPEAFFKSRFSVRDFSDKPVPHEVIKRAINLGMKSPSACNRQAWHVYHADSRATIDSILRHQTGNRGFGHEVPCLLIIASDLRAFSSADERYQHWIDGGVFSMGVILALHSLGVDSCCLNWSKNTLSDLGLRRAILIDPAHTVIMMVAAGYASENLMVCNSARSPIENIYTYLK